MTTAYTYNSRGLLTAVTDALNQAEGYTYDTNGNVLTKTDRNSTTFSYTYDGAGRLLNTKNGLNVLASFTYTLTGAVRTEQNTNLTATYTYDTLGRVTKVSESNTGVGSGRGSVEKSYSYNDVAGGRTAFTLKVNNVTEMGQTYAYDEMNRLTGVYSGGALEAAYTHDSNGNRASLMLGNGVVIDYTYNKANLGAKGTSSCVKSLTFP